MGNAGEVRNVMRRVLVALVLGVLALIGAGTASGDDAPASPDIPVPDSLTITGSAVLADPAALPQGALLIVTLEDTSRADAPALIIGQAQVQLNGLQSSVTFSLLYPRSAVLPQAVYTIRARVVLGDRLLFTTTENTPVDALNPVPVQLRLQPVPAAEAPPIPDVSLTDTYWKLTEVAGRPVQVTEGMREPSLVLATEGSRFAGSGGVNRLMGGYTLDGGSLSFSNAASTMMAGPPEAMQQEQAIAAALGQVVGFRISSDQLWLVDGAGRPVLRAVAVAL